MDVVSQPTDPFIRMTRQMELENTSATSFRLDVSRVVRLLDGDALTNCLATRPRRARPGRQVGRLRDGQQITNRGAR